MDMPKDKFIATVKVGDKGADRHSQGSPRPVRHLSRDTLLLLADRQQALRWCPTRPTRPLPMRSSKLKSTRTGRRTDMDALRVENLCKRYSGGFALENVSFSLAEGSIMGLIGANGAGKTSR